MPSIITRPRFRFRRRQPMLPRTKRPLSFTSRGTVSNTGSGTGFSMIPPQNFTAGTTAAVCLVVDNGGTNGGLLTSFSITDSLGNTYTRRLTKVYDPGAANEGVEIAIFTTPMNGGTITTGTLVSVSFGSQTVAVKQVALVQINHTTTLYYGETGDNGGSATDAPTGTTSFSLREKDGIIAICGNERGTGQTVTGDADTTNGSWSTAQTSTGGTAAAGITISEQHKVATGSGQQTYNPTLGTSSDVMLAWLILSETDFPTATGSPFYFRNFVVKRGGR